MNNDNIAHAILELSKGNIIILVDHADRENEGDFIQISELVTPKSVNFMITHGKGLLCQAITSERAKELNLELQVSCNTSLHDTAFTVSVDALEGTTTGISAFDRAKTILAIADEHTKPEDLGRPGHIFPIIAHDGGLFSRLGHTEGSIELARMAGKKPNAVICEILNNEGLAASRDEMRAFADKHGMIIVSIEEIVDYKKGKGI